MSSLLRRLHGLDPVQEQKLIPIIERKFGIQVRSIQQKIDPDLIGGFVVTANHKTLDTSLKHQLQVIKSKFEIESGVNFGD